MKSAHAIAKQCKIDKRFVYNLIKSNEIIGIEIDNSYYYNKEQEELIHRILYYERKIDFVVIESIINK